MIWYNFGMSIGDFEKIYKLYEKELKSFIYTIARQDMFIAEDILQNTMVNAYKYIHTLKDDNLLKPWLFKIARNESARYFSQNDNSISLFGENDRFENKHEQLIEDDISIEFVSTEEFIRLVNKLSINEQTVLILCYRYGYKLYEIAEMQNENKNTVKSIHLRAIKKLKKIIEGETEIESE